METIFKNKNLQIAAFAGYISALVYILYEMFE